jgi:hypothetical protein
MSAKLVIEHIVETQGINLSTLTDKDFSQMSWLDEYEPIIGLNGESISKSYYYKKKEAIRIVYGKIYGDFEYQGIVYQNTYLGLTKQICWIDWAGEIGDYTKTRNYYFNLKPIDVNDLSKGFTSLKMRKIQKEEANNLII